MDRKLQQRQEIERLMRVSESARSTLDDAALLLRQKLDFPTRIRGSLKSNPAGWLVGSLASGLAASWIFSRKPTSTEKKHRSLPMKLIGLSLTAVQPMARAWLSNQVKNYFSTPRRSYPESSPHSDAF